MPTRGARGVCVTWRSCLSKNRTCEDLPRRLVAGWARGRFRWVGHQLLRGDGDDHPRVAGRGRRGTRHPADARPGRRARHPVPGSPGQAGAPGGHPDRPGRRVRVGRPTGPTGVVAARHRVRRGRRRRCRRGVGAAGGGRAELPAAGRRVRHLADLPVAADRAAAPGRAGRGSGSGRSRPGRGPPADPAWVLDPGRPDRRRRDGRCRGGPGRRRRSPSCRGDAPAAAAVRRHGADHPQRGPDRGPRGLDVADAERRLLPDPHRDRGPDDRAEGLAAADPRHGRPRAGADLRRAARPAAHGGVDHPELRVQRGRRRPDRQRLVERRTHRGPAGHPGRARRSERRAPDVPGRLDLRHPPRRSCGTTAMRCWPWP